MRISTSITSIPISVSNMLAFNQCRQSTFAVPSTTLELPADASYSLLLVLIFEEPHIRMLAKEHSPPLKLAWLRSVNHQDITRNNWNDVASPKQEQVHHNMFLMDVQLWLPASKLMYVNFHCIQHHQFGGASACRRTWRCPPSHP